jgi:hypothetical protein
MPAQTDTQDDARLIATAKKETGKILDQFAVAGRARSALDAISPRKVIRDSAPVRLTRTDEALVLAAAGADIGFATNSIVIANGPVKIAHSTNNVIIAGGSVQISHDGSVGTGSLVITKGKLTISHATGTLLYAPKGVEIAHASGVRSFNTIDRTTSWGTIQNVLVEPLFEDEGSVVGR